LTYNCQWPSFLCHPVPCLASAWMTGQLQPVLWSQDYGLESQVHSSSFSQGISLSLETSSPRSRFWSRDIGDKVFLETLVTRSWDLTAILFIVSDWDLGILHGFKGSADYRILGRIQQYWILSTALMHDIQHLGFLFLFFRGINQCCDLKTKLWKLECTRVHLAKVSVLVLVLRPNFQGLGLSQELGAKVSVSSFLKGLNNITIFKPVQSIPGAATAEQLWLVSLSPTEPIMDQPVKSWHDTTNRRCWCTRTTVIGAWWCKATNHGRCCNGSSCDWLASTRFNRSEATGQNSVCHVAR